MGVRLFKNFLLALVDTASKKPGPDHSGTNHSCSLDAQGSNGVKHTGDLMWQIAQIQKMAMQTHLEVNEKTSAEIFVEENMCFTGKKIRARSSKQ